MELIIIAKCSVCGVHFKQFISRPFYYMVPVHELLPKGVILQTNENDYGLCDNFICKNCDKGKHSQGELF